jgi:hypothetical protein
MKFLLAGSAINEDSAMNMSATATGAITVSKSLIVILSRALFRQHFT